MTKSQIIKLGFPFVGSKLRPRAFHSIVGEIIIPDHFGINEIHKLIFDKGFEQGVMNGKLIQANRFRKSLGQKPLSHLDISYLE